MAIVYFDPSCLNLKGGGFRFKPDVFEPEGVGVQVQISSPFHRGLHCGHLSSPVEASKQAKTIAQIVQCSWGSFGSLICAILFWGLVYWYTGSPVHKYTGTSVHRCTVNGNSSWVHRYTGIPVYWHTDTPRRQYTGTPKRLTH